MAGNTVDIRTKNLTKPVDVADYLFTRLHQIGVRSVHGLPGDYNLVALDYLPQNGLKWVGSVNELNAGKYLTLLPMFSAILYRSGLT
jgi:pyruvate decarboxylase